MHNDNDNSGNDKYGDKKLHNNIVGHAEKWSNKNRRSNSHDSGQGDKGSRNMGTGLQGKFNTMPSHSTDTSSMGKDEKLKYFKSLGLMPSDPQSVKPKLKDFPDLIRSTFAGETEYLKDISQALKSIPRQEYQSRIQAALDSFYNTSQESEDVYDLYAAIMQALN